MKKEIKTNSKKIARKCDLPPAQSALLFQFAKLLLIVLMPVMGFLLSFYLNAMHQSMDEMTQSVQRLERLIENPKP